MSTSTATIDTEPAVPVERLRAVIALLTPEEMTPTAERILSMLCDEYGRNEDA